MNNYEPATYVPEPVPFEVFFKVYAHLNGFKVPEFHYDLIRFLSDYKDWENGMAVLQMFRGAAKSTITGVWLAWLFTVDPTLRVLVLSETGTTAEKMVRAVQDIITRHPLAQHLKPGKDEKLMWKNTTLFVKGYTDPRSPSITGRGIFSALTGSRADIIVFDDVEAGTNTDTEQKRKKLRYALGEPLHILVPGGKQLFIGTPHTYESIYPELNGEVQPYYDDVRIGNGGKLSKVKVAVLKNMGGQYPEITGEPVWPERFSLDLVRQRCRIRARGEMFSQYFLIPYKVDGSLIDPTKIGVYDDEIRTDGMGKTYLGNKLIVGAKTFWDPALGGPTSTGSALAVVLADDFGHQYLHYAGLIAGEPQEQCKLIITILTALGIRQLTIESNGIGGFMSRLFKKEAEGTGIVIVGFDQKGNKADRIVENLGYPIDAGYFWMHKRMINSKFVTQLQDFSKKLATHVDVIDATASACAAAPKTMHSGHAGDMKRSWQKPTITRRYTSNYRPF